jgi:hypothetical protein
MSQRQQLIRDMYRLVYVPQGRTKVPGLVLSDVPEEEQEEKVVIIPRMMLFIDDDTEYWSQDMVKRSGGRICSAHFFNERRAVHICEITPSFEMFFVESFAPDYPQLRSLPLGASPITEARREREWERRREAFESELREADRDTPRVGYRHVRDIDLTKCTELWALTGEEWAEQLGDKDGDEEKAYDALCDATQELINQNGYY